MPALVLPVDLGPGARAFVTGRDRAETPAPGAPADDAGPGVPGNLSHRRPHQPDALAHARREVGELTETDPSRWHLMHQVHGAEVADVDADTPPGAELREVDGAVTAEPDRVLAVATADCVPVLFAGPTAVGVAHAGRAGVVAGVVGAVVARLTALGSPPDQLTVALGPAIGGCCYEVPTSLRDAVAAELPATAATTRAGTPGLDLPAGVEAQLDGAGVVAVTRVGGCTRCDPQRRWFSHRADPGTGRQLGLVTRRGVAA
ncbi:laccase domain-containing protein [Nitriliruptoraceae bacterium ZYF776]|nr:laccase domain-containing protein [Profundirhabdus halotolerans]